MNKAQKQLIFNVVMGNRFSLAPQEMAQFIEALNALASDINAETAEVQVPVRQETKGGDPFAEAGG